MLYLLNSLCSGMRCWTSTGKSYAVFIKSQTKITRRNYRPGQETTLKGINMRLMKLLWKWWYPAGNYNWNNCKAWSAWLANCTASVTLTVSVENNDTNKKYSYIKMGKIIFDTNYVLCFRLTPQWQCLTWFSNSSAVCSAASSVSAGGSSKRPCAEPGDLGKTLVPYCPQPLTKSPAFLTFLSQCPVTMMWVSVCKSNGVVSQSNLTVVFQLELESWDSWGADGDGLGVKSSQVGVASVGSYSIT